MLFSSDTAEALDPSRISIHWRENDGSDRELQNPEIHIVRVTNSGRVGVTSGDFISPIVITIPEGVDTIAATVSGLRHPGISSFKDLPIQKAGAQDSIEVPVVGLSAKDWIEIEVLTAKAINTHSASQLQQSKVESWISKRKQSELTTARLLTVNCWIADQSRPVRRSDTEVDAMLWRAIPVVSTKKVAWSLGSVYVTICIMASIASGQSVLDFVWKIPLFIAISIVAVVAVGAFYAAIFLPLVGAIWLIRKLVIAALGFLVKRIENRP